MKPKQENAREMPEAQSLQPVCNPKKTPSKVSLQNVTRDWHCIILCIIKQ